VATTTVTPKRRARSESTWAVAWRRLRRHRFAMISLAILAIFILVAIFAPYLAPYDPFRQPRGAGIRAQFFQPPSSVHWLGTDDLGRDVFSRLIFGARISLLVGFTVAFSNIFVGTIMGTLAGYFSGRPFRFYLGPLNREGGGWHLPFALWRVLSWLLFYGALYLVARIAWTLAGPAVQAGFAGEWTTNSLFSALGLGVALAVVATIPSLPLLLILSALLRDPGTGFGRWTQAIFGDAASVFIIIFILALFGWISSARLVRGSILSIREQDFTTAAQALGVPQWRIMFRHLVPNAMAPIIVDGTLAVGVAILVEAALSFLGFGIQPPVATWGNMLNNAQNYIFFAPWLAFPPGILIVITVLAINFLGDGLRDALDPRSQL
jgi:peptide/nickel transport system permease protein